LRQYRIATPYAVFITAVKSDSNVARAAAVLRPAADASVGMAEGWITKGPVAACLS
jgi:hypothetical protein